MVEQAVIVRHIEITDFIQYFIVVDGLEPFFTTIAPNYSTKDVSYHCLFALARERITVAITFIVSTKTSNTSAVPYWIWIGISGTCVEMTKR